MNAQSDNLIGQASCFLEVIEQVSSLAPIDKPVLVVGERGTGKEAIAARLHFLSGRWDQPFVKLNCAAINENLLETELFGHESGAFTGANKRHIGRFELANGGSLFLDELGNSSLAVQEKLLRVIEYGEMERVGGSKSIKVDVRLIAATNADLPLRARQGSFRSDLLDRLAFDVVTLPPLRARGEDIMVLAQHFALAMTRELGRDVFTGFSRRVEEALIAYPWPGNVRELKNVIERNIYKTPPDQLIDDIVFDPFTSPFRLGETQSTDGQPNTFVADAGEQSKPGATSGPQDRPTSPSLITYDFPLDLKKVICDAEIEIIQKALKNAQYNQKKCAQLLGLTYHQLRGYLKKYQLLDQK